MNRKNITVVMLFVFLVTNLFMFNTTEVIAAISNSNVLVITGGVTINKSDTLEDVIRKYGKQPVLSTPSPIGGTINSFLKDDYSSYLYIETRADGKIIAAGVASKDFQTPFRSYGDPYSGSVSYMEGRDVNDWDDGSVGALLYNTSNINYELIGEYRKNYKANYEYEKYVCQHGVYLTNYYHKNDYTNAEELKFDDDVYSALAKLEDTTGLKIEEYCQKNNKSNYMKIANYETGYLANYEALPNPFRFAQNTMNYTATGNKNLAYFRYTLPEENSNRDARIWLSYVDKSILKGIKDIELTLDEKDKLQSAKEMYDASVEEFNRNGADIFITEPQYQTADLVAGQIYENKLKGAVKFLNMIRIAGGLPTVQYDADLSDIAQHKSVLVLYAKNFAEYKPTNPHYPPNYPEISDDFYNRAMQSMSGENLYLGSLITSIPNAINDGYGDPIMCGHRYNLLEPGWTRFGIGYAEGQATHRFGGSQSTSHITAVCWPQIGITPIEAYTGGYWTCKFYNGYSLNDDSYVIVKCLNNDYEYTFIPGEESFSHKCKMYKGSRLMSFYDGDIKGIDGYVYTITIKNVTNLSSGNKEDYTYRTAFKNIVTESQTSTAPTGITMSQSNVELTRGDSIVLNSTIQGQNVTEVATKYSSSNPYIAKVDQYGKVTTLSSGTATITVETLNGYKATCTVKVNRAPGDPKYKKGDLDRDGNVNADDAAVALDLYKYGNATGEDLLIGDIDGDGSLNADDAALILDIYKYGT